MSKIKLKSSNTIGPLLVLIFSLLPIMFWLAMKPMSERFGSTILTFVSLGQISALLGMSMFSISLILSARIKLLDNIFLGINRAYIWHHIIGGVAFILLLFHPLFLLARTLPISLYASARFLLPEGTLAKDLGVYSLVLMIILLVLTFFVSLRYEVWKNSHKFLGIAFFLGGLHSFFVYSDMAVNLSLRYYMLSLAILAISAYIYRTVLGLWMVKKYRYKLIKKDVLNKNILILTFEAQDKPMKYHAGQFVFINFVNRFLPKEVHPFSISSDMANENIFTLTIKVLGDYTQALLNIEVGEIARVEGPYGQFNYRNVGNKKQIWIAGGVGVTPFMSMCENVLNDDMTDYDIDFYYCTRDMSEQELINDLMERAKTLPNFKFVAHCSNDHGWVNVGFIKAHTKDIADRDIFLCGPPVLMNLLKKQFSELGININQIHSEEFNF